MVAQQPLKRGKKRLGAEAFVGDRADEPGAKRQTPQYHPEQVVPEAATMLAGIPAITADPRVPRGRRIQFSLAWYGEELNQSGPIRAPVLVSVRNAISEQYPPVPPASTLDVQSPESAPVQKASLRPGDADEARLNPVLAQIGRRDLLGETIRSMENRLARQGMLAAPETILAKKFRGKKKKQVGWEDFYDPSDAMIDDQALEEMNAHEDLMRSRGHQRNAGDASALGSMSGLQKGHLSAGEVDMQDDNDELGPTVPPIDLGGFRLTGPDVSGTSAESASEAADSDEDDDEGAGAIGDNSNREALPWRDRLATLREDMLRTTVVPKDADERPNPLDSADQLDASNSDDGLQKIQEALRIVCLAAEQWEQSPPEDRMLRQREFERSLRELWQGLPSFLRSQKQLPAASNGSSQTTEVRWGLLMGRGVNAKLKGDEDGLLRWDDAEEISWARFVWRLVRVAAPGFSRASFVRRWVDAARVPQREALATARSLATQKARSALDNKRRQAMQAAVRRWPQAATIAERAELLILLRPLNDALVGLRQCWFRQLFWEEQRHSHRLQASCRKEFSGGDIPRFAVHVIHHIREQLDVSVPMDMLVTYLRGNPSLSVRSAANSGSAGKPLNRDGEDGILEKAAKTEAQSEEKKLAESLVASDSPLIPVGRAEKKSKKCRWPIQLPVPVWFHVGNFQVECQLVHVKDLDKQRVVTGSGSEMREFRSLDDAARALYADAEKKAQDLGEDFCLTGKRKRQIKERGGGWAFFYLTEEKTSAPKVAKAGVQRWNLAGFLNMAVGRGWQTFLNPPGMEPCPELPQIACCMTQTSSSKKERNHFLTTLRVGQWVSAKYEGPSAPLHGSYYNCRVRNIHLDADGGFDSTPTQIDVEWVFGEFSEGVEMPNVKPVFIWAIGDTAAVYDRGRWWEGKVVSAIRHDDVAESKFEVKVGDRLLPVNFPSMRQASPADTAKGTCPKPDPAKQLDVAPAAGAAPPAGRGGRGRGRGGGASGGRGGGRGKVAPSPPKLAKGTAVRFMDAGCWWRGKVHEDFGNFVHVQTQDRKKSSAEVTWKSVPREHIEELPERGSYSTPGGRAGIISVEDSE